MITSWDTQPTATQTPHLTDEQAEVIRQMVANGGYDDASQVVDDALRLRKAQQEEQEAELEWLRSWVQKGVDAFERRKLVQLNSEGGGDPGIECGYPPSSPRNNDQPPRWGAVSPPVRT